MATCPSSCGDIDLIGNPQTDCEVSLRQTTPSRFAFFGCTTTLPDPITDVAIKALFDDGTIVASSELANVEFADPTTEDITISDCKPPLRQIVSREVTFEDRTAISRTAGSPATTDPFFDYDFWQDKLDNQGKLNYMVIYCNGDVKIARDKDGNLLSATMQGWLNYQRPGTAGNKSTEFKRLSILFDGDPLAMYNKPEFNYIEAGITL